MYIAHLLKNTLESFFLCSLCRSRLISWKITWPKVEGYSYPPGLWYGQEAFWRHSKSSNTWCHDKFSPKHQRSWPAMCCVREHSDRMQVENIDLLKLPAITRKAECIICIYNIYILLWNSNGWVQHVQFLVIKYNFQNVQMPSYRTFQPQLCPAIVPTSSSGFSGLLRAARSISALRPTWVSHQMGLENLCGSRGTKKKISKMWMGKSNMFKSNQWFLQKKCCLTGLKNPSI